MRSQQRNLGIAVFAALIVIVFVWWRLGQNAHAPSPSAMARSASSNSVGTLANTTAQPDSINNAAVTNSPEDMVKAYRQGLVSKDEVMRQVWANENARPLDFYGKVVDQNSQPVAGATVTGSIMYVEGLHSPHKFQETTTDADGFFKFVGLHGAALGLIPSKPGYEYQHKYSRSNWTEDYRPDANDPMVFTMWKLKGPEPMIHTDIDGRIPYDGSPAVFDLLVGRFIRKRIEKGQAQVGDLRITLSRTPLEIDRGDRCDWDVRIEVVGGGLVEITDMYPNLAPEGGYQPFFEFTEKKDDPQFSPRLTKAFYVSTARGMYGRVRIDLVVDSARPEIGLGVGVGIEAWMNPSGSRNLEYVREKEIQPSQVPQRQAAQ